jgi:hypothetical protein
MRWLGFVLWGCVSTASPKAQVTSRDVVAMSVRDPAKLEALVKGGVTLGGIAFADAACTEFAAPGELVLDRAAFAACLVGLHLDVSPRRSTFPDVIVLKYAPGFELEARLVDGRITWIGASARRAGERDIATITHDALEQLRVAGERSVKLEVDGAAWFKVCLDETGAASADLYETSSIATAVAFRSALARWKFKPFMTQGQPRPVCAMVHMASPPTRDVETLPAAPPVAKSGKPAIVFSLGGGVGDIKRISGVIAVAPDDLTKIAIMKSGQTKVRGLFRVCMSEAGAVEAVFPLVMTGFPDYDRKLTSMMTDWQYAPFVLDGQPQPFCTTVEFRYQQR